MIKLSCCLESGRGSISLQSPVYYQVETESVQKKFELVTGKELPLFLSSPVLQ